MQPPVMRSAPVLWGLLAVLAVALAAAYPMQVNGWNQNAHYALVRALAQGTPAIDRTRHEIGDLGTGDISVDDGHEYSNKAPGLAMATLPAFFAVEAVGMRTTGDPTRVIWALHLFSIVVPVFLLLVLVRRVAEWVEPGYGTAAAVTLGLGTLVLPFATLFFAHVLAASLAFAGFAALWHERQSRERLLLVGLGGVLVGLGVATEYPVALAGLVLGAYALARSGWVRRGLAYAGGALAGVAPLLLYNTWAFGSPTHLSYERNQVEELEGFFGFAVPRPQIAFDLLFSAWGLLAVTPVVACGVAGSVLLYRRGVRAEALVFLAVPLLQLIYNSGLRFSAFGGQGYPRYTIYAVPFLAVPLAVAYRAIPLTTIALAVVSAFQMTVVTATNPLAAYDGDWLERLTSRTFSQTGASVVGVTGWYAIIPFFVAVLAAVVFTGLSTRASPTSVADAVLAFLALLAWGVIALRGDNPIGNEFRAGYVVPMAIGVGILVAALAGAGRLTPGRRLSSVH
jgi:hypothetical protein